jgi:hypothetical protein
MAIRTDSVPTTAGQTSGDFFTDDIARATTYAVTNGARGMSRSMLQMDGRCPG